jgi:hypothetical protein
VRAQRALIDVSDGLERPPFPLHPVLTIPHDSGQALRDSRRKVQERANSLERPNLGHGLCPFAGPISGGDAVSRLIFRLRPAMPQPSFVAGCLMKTAGTLVKLAEGMASTLI